MASKRTHRHEKLARIYDKEILPIWSKRFGRMLLRDMRLPDRAQVLDVACGTGYPATEIVRKLGDGGRLIAIDESSALLDVARTKMAEMGAKGVFFRSESALPKLSFADDVYDMVVCNLGLWEMPNPATAFADFARVTKPGGEVRCTLPLAGTFQEFYDIFREVLVKHDKHEVLERLNAHLRRYPTPEECDRWIIAAGLREPRVDVEEFSLLFRSSREFFFAPIIEFGPLIQWKRVAGTGQELQDIFWYIKEAIDAYFGGRAFQITIKAGCVAGTKGETIEDDVTDEVEPLHGDTDEIELSTDEIQIEELDTWRSEPDDIELDAFVEGRRRPSHLDED